jgi:hypothetical protein
VHACQNRPFRKARKNTLSNNEEQSIDNHFLVLELQAKFFDFYYSHFLNPPSSDNDLASEARRGVDSKRISGIKSQFGYYGRDGVTFTDVPPSVPVKMKGDYPFLDLAVAGSLGLSDRTRVSDNGSTHLRSHKYKCLEHYIVLMGRTSGVPIAICALKTQLGLPVVRIYCTKRRVAGQRRAALTSKLGFNWTYSYPLYTWAEIKTHGVHPMPFSFSIYMATGPDGRFEESPSYRAVSNMFTTCPDIRVVGRTGSEEFYSGCAILKATQNDPSNPLLELTLSRGIDPGLFICFAAVVDEIMEDAIRQFCNDK